MVNKNLKEDLREILKNSSLDFNDNLGEENGNKNKRGEQNNRKGVVMDILIKKVKNNLDTLFNFELSNKEFKENYKVTKGELLEII